jgi:hypothetical protein
MKRRCPTCKNQFEWTAGKNAQNGKDYFPFCSLRCKLVDLGAWFDESYKIVKQFDDNKQENDNT